MEWLRNNTFIIPNRQQIALLPTQEECDPSACYDSFKEHWQQALKIIQRNQQLPSHDDVLGVVNHLEQMVSLLLFDIKAINQINLAISTTSQCLEYLLTENLLDKLYDWGIRTGKYCNAVRLEQLKLYEMLIIQSRHLLLVHDPFLRPMLKLMESFQNDVLPNDIEKRLVTLLYQLWILLTQNIDLVDLFFIKGHKKSKFIIFVLLIRFIHRNDSVGMKARDALVLCMLLTKKKKNICDFISQQSNICVLLATGLSGLYSELPHVLTDISVPDWHRLTKDDIEDIKDLSNFVTSLEFINAIAKDAHPNIANDMQEFIFRGFFIPVLGPHLIQSSVGEQMTATAYLELILRRVTHPGLLYPLLKFLFLEQDKQRLLNILISRIDSEPQLTLVSLALFDSLVAINCEDVMLELVFQYLQPCLHLMLSQRRLQLPLDPQCQNFEYLLALAPTCCDPPSTSPRLDGRQVHWNYYSAQQSLYGNYHAYLCDARNKINASQAACTHWSNAYTGCEIDDNQVTCTDETVNSLPSLSESSGYASLKLKVENTSDDSNYLPVWQISHARMNNKTMFNKNNCVIEGNETLSSSGTAGPFLTILLDKLKHMLNNTFYINLHLTGLISRLAVYPQPLLRTYLLDHSLVLQPNVPSLFQIIGSLKQTIDEYMFHQSDRIVLIQQAKNFLLARETRLVNARRNTTDRISLSSSTSVTTIDSDQPFQRNGPKRKSLTISISSMFGRRPSQAETTIPMVIQQEDKENVLYPKFNEAQHVAICAVLLDEWVKELAALAQEHTISQFAALFK